MEQGTVAHLFCEGKVILGLRDKARPGEKFAWPDHWDSFSETLEEKDRRGQATLVQTLWRGMRRGLGEEICMVPKGLEFFGLTRGGHGFFYANLSRRERWSIRLGDEGRCVYAFDLHELSGLKLGGSIRYHLEAYPHAFEKMAAGIIPDRRELGLRTIEEYSLVATK